jgi:hypothetical protein
MALVPVTGQIIIFRAQEFDIHLMQLSHSCQSDKCYKTFPSVTTALAKIATPPSPSGTQLDAPMEQCPVKI